MELQSKILVLQSVCTSTSQNNMRAPSTMSSPLFRDYHGASSKGGGGGKIYGLCMQIELCLSLPSFSRTVEATHSCGDTNRAGGGGARILCPTVPAILPLPQVLLLTDRAGGQGVFFVLLSAIRALEQCACVRLFSPSISAAQK